MKEDCTVSNVRSMLIGAMHQQRSCDQFIAHGLSTHGEYTFGLFPSDHTSDEIPHHLH